MKAKVRNAGQEAFNRSFKPKFRMPSQYSVERKASAQLLSTQASAAKLEASSPVLLHCPDSKLWRVPDDHGQVANHSGHFPSEISQLVSGTPGP